MFCIAKILLRRFYDMYMYLSNNIAAAVIGYLI